MDMQINHPIEIPINHVYMSESHHDMRVGAYEINFSQPVHQLRKPPSIPSSTAATRHRVDPR